MRSGVTDLQHRAEVTGGTGETLSSKPLCVGRFLRAPRLVAPIPLPQEERGAVSSPCPDDNSLGHAVTWLRIDPGCCVLPGWRTEGRVAFGQALGSTASVPRCWGSWTLGSFTCSYGFWGVIDPAPRHSTGGVFHPVPSTAVDEYSILSLRPPLIPGF